MLGNYEFPQVSEILARQKEALAKIMFTYSSPQQQHEIGLINALLGAGENLWSSPHELLTTDKRILRPEEYQTIQSLAHGGILGNVGSCHFKLALSI